MIMAENSGGWTNHIDAPIARSLARLRFPAMEQPIYKSTSLGATNMDLLTLAALISLWTGIRTVSVSDRPGA